MNTYVVKVETYLRVEVEADSETQAVSHSLAAIQTRLRDSNVTVEVVSPVRVDPVPRAYVLRA